MAYARGISVNKIVWSKLHEILNFWDKNKNKNKKTKQKNKTKQNRVLFKTIFKKALTPFWKTFL